VVWSPVASLREVAMLMSHGGRLISLALFFTLYTCHDFSPPFFIEKCL
jgi:hypothetical protein